MERELEFFNAQQRLKGATALGGDPATIGVLEAGVGEARRSLANEKRGYLLTLADCFGLGRSVSRGYSYGFSRFRCELSVFSLGDKTVEFSAKQLRALLAVPRPPARLAAWHERQAADRLETYGHIVDPAKVEERQKELQDARAHMAEVVKKDPTKFNWERERVREREKALADDQRGVPITSASCLGVGTSKTHDGREYFGQFRCRARGGDANAFVVMEALTPSKFRIRSTRQLTTYA